MKNKPTALELKLLASFRLLKAEKALLENQLKNALAEIDRLKKLNNG